MKSDKYYIAELEDKIIELVWKQTKDIPRPWGLILSGGFDSGLLAALIKPDYVYSLGFPYGPKYDESFYRDAIIKYLGIEHKIMVVDFKKEDFIPNLREAVKIMGEPVSHFSLAPFNFLMKLIKQRPHKPINVFSGEGIDEYLGGYARYIIFDELNKLHQIPELRNYKQLIPRALGFENLIQQYGEMMGYGRGVGNFRFMHDVPFLGILGKMDMEFGVIEKMEQKLAKAYEVNLHYSYINQVFAEYCYMLPDHLKVRNGVTKWAFRQVCKKYLPETMMDRSKQGGPVAPVGLWLEEENEFGKEKYIKLQKEILNEKD